MMLTEEKRAQNGVQVHEAFVCVRIHYCTPLSRLAVEEARVQ